MSAWADWLKAIQLKPRFLFGLFFLGVVVLGMPDCWSDFLGFACIRHQYRGLISVGTIAAFVFWVVQLVPVIRQRIRTARARKQVIASIDSLAMEERLLLAYCIARGQRTVTLELTDRVAQALATKGLLVRATGTSSILAWPFTIVDFVWEYLNDNPGRLFGDSPPTTQQQLAFFQRMDEHIHRHDRWG